MNILVIGGNRFFGRHLVKELLDDGHKITLLNRSSSVEDFKSNVAYIKADRTSEDNLEAVTRGQQWDLIYDQVCYTASEAESACRIFKNKTKRYVVTSSESVYDNGMNQVEDRFDPRIFSFVEEADRNKDYQGAKRQMESVFIRHAEFEVAIARPSIVVGVDDYTKRLSWHIERIRAGLPMYVPDIDIQSDFIRSDQAGQAMKIIGLSSKVGAVNCTTPGAVSLRKLIEMCEEAVGRKAILAANHEGDNHSPYGGSASKTMNTDLLCSLGFDVPSSEQWLGDRKSVV